jgi:hypothetical protein
VTRYPNTVPLGRVEPGAGIVVVRVFPGCAGSTSEATLRARQGSYCPFTNKTLLVDMCQPWYLLFVFATSGPPAVRLPKLLMQYS